MMTEGLGPAEEEPGKLSPGADVVGPVFWCDAYIGARWSPSHDSQLLQGRMSISNFKPRMGSVYNRCSINDTDNSKKKDL